MYNAYIQYIYSVSIVTLCIHTDYGTYMLSDRNVFHNIKFNIQNKKMIIIKIKLNKNKPIYVIMQTKLNILIFTRYSEYYDYINL